MNINTPYITQTLNRDTYDNKPLITMHAVFVASSEEIQQGLATDSGSIGIDHITNFPDSSSGIWRPRKEILGQPRANIVLVSSGNWETRGNSPVHFFWQLTTHGENTLFKSFVSPNIVLVSLCNSESCRNTPGIFIGQLTTRRNDSPVG